MKSETLISIIVPVYNAGEYIERCINSLIKQTYENLEVICVNDGSNDNSLKILSDFAETDSRIRIINKTNQGVAKARNDGINSSNGSILMFVDADDWIEADTCEYAIKVMEKENADIVMWAYVSEKSGCNTVKSVFPSDCVFDDRQVKHILQRRMIGLCGDELAHPELADSLCPVWGKLYKTELIKKTIYNL